MSQTVCPLCNSPVQPSERVCRLCGEELPGDGSSPPPTASYVDVRQPTRPLEPIHTREPEPGRPRDWYRSGRLQAVAVGVFLVVLVLSIGLLLRDPGDSEEAAPQPATTPTGQPVPSTVESSTEVPEPVTTTEEPEMDEEQVALTALGQLADQGLATVDRDGRWVAQLTSKAPGVTDPYQQTSSGSHTFTAVDILEQVEELLGRPDLGQVFLLRSTDYGRRQTYHGQPMWVVFADAGFSSRAQVWTWCENTFHYQGDELENACAVRRLKDS